MSKLNIPFRTCKPSFNLCSKFFISEGLAHFHLLYDSFFTLANAWEEEDEIVLITCRLENPNLDMVGGAVKEKLDNFANEL